MLKIQIKKDNVLTNEAQFETQDECDAWALENQKAFGKPERWVAESELEKEGEDPAFAIAEMTEPILGQEVKLYKFAATFQSVVEDITAQLLLEKEKAEALKYLSETDWYVIRHSETQVAIPTEVLTLRAAARLKA